jgi:hypothetical protein
VLSVWVPSAAVDFDVVVELSVPGGGATTIGVVVVVDCEVVDCAAATPVIMPRAITPASKDLVILGLSKVKSRVGMSWNCA